MFKNITNNYAHLIAKTNCTLRSAATKRFKESGINMSIESVVALIIIIEHDGMTHAEFAEMAKVAKGNATKIINVLLKEKLIKKITNKKDKRSIRLEATAAGMKLHDKARIVLHQLSEYIMQHISQEEMDQLVITLQKLYALTEGQDE